MKNFWSGLFWANWAIILVYWWIGSGSELSGGWAFWFIALGRLTGLAAAYFVLLQFFLMGRMPWLERVYGLDKLSRLHSVSGKWGILLILLHPILLVVGYSAISGLGWWAQFLSMVGDLEHVFLAFLGLLAFLVVVGTSLYIVRSRLRYESWYFVHLTAYLAVFLSYWHQLNGTTIIHNRTFYLYWVGLYLVVFGSHLAFRIVRPIYLSLKHKFEVSRVVRENYNTVSIYITGRELSQFPILPGQFMIVRFFTRELWWQAHPFSLSMMPDGKELRVTVKELGDFTKEVQHVTPGTRMYIDGPYGVFTDFLGMSAKVLLIAGGIGITPIRALIEEMLKKGRDVVLLYGNRAENDIVFKKELEALQATYPARIIHILSDEAAFAGERGHIDEEKIARLVPDVANREVYLCGPLPMMNAVVTSLTNLGLKKTQIHYEKFSLA